MKLLFRSLVLAIVLVFAADMTMAQTTKWREIHKVKRKETVFGIAKDNGLTIEELLNANPEMKKPGYELKKGDYIFIPFPSSVASKQQTTAQTPAQSKAADSKSKAVRVGVMLPLHNENGDGTRMTEYYRGVLMACDSLRCNGISVDIHAWNVAENADINKTLRDNAAAQCDVIIGPLYSTQVKALSDFSRKHNIKVLIPFSINAPELHSNPNIFQVYQSPTDFNEAAISRFLDKFAGYHTVFIDCNDTTSRKGIFTFGLRRRMEAMGRSHSITNLKSSDVYFSKAFSRTMPNVVVLNTGRSPELNVAFAKLNNLTMNDSKVSVSMFGYTEWMMYTKYNLDNYYKYNVFIPAAFYTNPLSAKTARIEQKYRWNFHADMLQALPRFAITGFDHAYYFIKGLSMYGDKFTGAAGVVGYTPIQTPLRFVRVGDNGGYRNNSLLLVHYTPGHKIETLYY